MLVPPEEWWMASANIIKFPARQEVLIESDST